MDAFKPSLQVIHELINASQGNTIPIYTQIPADLLTPVIAYLRISAKSQFSFLFESVVGGEKIGRYSFLGADLYKVLKTGDIEAITGDPLIALEEELKNVKFVPVPGVPSFTVNPSPYMFYIDLKDYQIVGASPELLVKVGNDMVYTHPVASIHKRGKTEEEGEKLAEELFKDLKEKALVDLGINDINRVCQPKTVKVDSLMQIIKFSHVMYIVSQVSGKLRPEENKFGIAIRTILFKDGAAYIQTGGGITYDDLEDDECQKNTGDTVYDNRDGDEHQETGDEHQETGDEHQETGDEYQETIDKLKSNVTCVDDAKRYYYKLRHKL